MSIVLLILGSFMLYGKSQFFPEHLSTIGNFIKQNKKATSIVGYLFLVCSYVCFSLKLGWGTGFIIYLVTLSLLYNILIIVLTLHKRYVYLIATFYLLLIFFQNTIV